jgi:hypothetical protein
MDISEFSRLEQTSRYARHPWEIARSKVMLRLLSEKVPMPQDRLVDVGSGDAYVIHVASANKMANAYSAIDIAYTPEIVAQLKSNNPSSPVGYYASMEDMTATGHSAGTTLYLCMDVLEHLENEKIVLDQIVREPLKENPAFYLFSVPAFQSVFSNHDVLLGHYRRYKVSELKQLCIRRGLTVIDSGYFFFSLLLARWWEKKLLKKKDYSIDNWEGSATKTKILTAILYADFMIGQALKRIGIKLPGLSCYCICRT